MIWPWSGQKLSQSPQMINLKSFQSLVQSQQWRLLVSTQTRWYGTRGATMKWRSQVLTNLHEQHERLQNVSIWHGHSLYWQQILSASWKSQLADHIGLQWISLCGCFFANLQLSKAVCLSNLRFLFKQRRVLFTEFCKFCYKVGPKYPF